MQKLSVKITAQPENLLSSFVHKELLRMKDLKVYKQNFSR